MAGLFLDKRCIPELVPESWNRLSMYLNCGRNTLYPVSAERTCVLILLINSDFGSKNRFERLVTGNQTP